MENEEKGNFLDREKAGIVKAVAKSPVAKEPTKEPPVVLTSHQFPLYNGIGPCGVAKL